MSPIEVLAQAKVIYEEIGKVECEITRIQSQNTQVLTNTQKLAINAVTAQLLAIESSIHDLCDETIDALMEVVNTTHDPRH